MRKVPKMNPDRKVQMSARFVTNVLSLCMELEDQEELTPEISRLRSAIMAEIDQKIAAEKRRKEYRKTITARDTPTYP